MDIQTFVSIGIVGATLAYGLEWLNSALKLNNLDSKILALVVSLIVGTGYYFLTQSSYFDSVIGILTSATTIWALLINNGKKPEGVEI